MDAKRLVREGYERAAARYHEWSATVDAEPRHRYLAELAAHLQPGARVLELGCGTGLTTREVVKRFDVVGVDFAFACLRMAQAVAPSGSYIQGDMTQIAFRPESFDGVIALYSMIHVPRADQPLVLRHASRWLRPGGLLLINLGANDAEAGFEQDWRGVPMFWSSYDSATNVRAVETAGFAVVHADEVVQQEDGDPVTFLWVLARRS